MSIHKPVTLYHGKPPEQPDYSRKLINAAFCGRLEPSDILHMARALLQVSDEVAELRERIRGIEMAVRK